MTYIRAFSAYNYTDSHNVSLLMNYMIKCLKAVLESTVFNTIKFVMLSYTHLHTTPEFLSHYEFCLLYSGARDLVE